MPNEVVSSGPLALFPLLPAYSAGQPAAGQTVEGRDDRAVSAPSTAEILVDLIEGRVPALPFEGFSPRRQL